MHEAKEEVIILSPWVNSSAFNNDLCSLIGEAIKRGVHVRIGYSAYKGQDVSEEQKSVLEVRNTLNFYIPNSLKNLLEMKAIDNLFTKTLICDRTFAVISSFNWLSDLGQQNHSETGSLVRSREQVIEQANIALQLLLPSNETKASSPAGLSSEPSMVYRGPVKVSYEDFERFLRDQTYEYWSVDKPAIEQFMPGYGTEDELMQAITINGDGSNSIYIFSEEDNLEEISAGINWKTIPQVHKEDLSHYIVTPKPGSNGKNFLYFDCSLDEASIGNPAILLPYEVEEEDIDKQPLDSSSIIAEYYGLVAVPYDEFESFLNEQENKYWYVYKSLIEEFSGGSPLTVEEIMQILYEHAESGEPVYIFRHDRPPEETISATNWEAIPKIRKADLYDYIIRSASGGKDFL